MAEGDGVLEPIASLEDLPKKIMEAILEGFAKQPQDFAVLGLGFFCGYEGYDVLEHFMKAVPLAKSNPADLAIRMGAGPLGVLMPQAAVDVAKLQIFPMWSFAEFMRKFTSEGSTGIGKAVIPAQDVDTIMADPNRSPESKMIAAYAHNLKARIIMGSMSAIAAYAITRPGFLMGVGEIVKGIGEIVPG